MVDTLISTAKGIPQGKVIKKQGMSEKSRLNRKIKNMYDHQRYFLDRWKSIRDFQLPHLGHFDDTADKTNPGRRTDINIIRGVAWRSCQIFAAGILSGLTPPSRQWFRFVFSNPELNANIAAMRVLDERYEIVSKVLAGSNFYNAVHSVYMELPFGQCPLAVFNDAEKGVRFQPLNIGTYALEADGFGRVRTVARKLEMTIDQLVDCFGIESLPRSMQRMAENNAGDQKKFTVYWLVEVNKERKPGVSGSMNMPYRSTYWLENSPEDEYLYRGGFEEWAIPVAQYLVNGLEPYGKGPGWDAEGDSKMLQMLAMDNLSAVELSVKPPMKAPASLLNSGGINLIPGGLTAVDDTYSNDAVKPVFQVSIDLKALQEEIIHTETAIKQAYSADLFLMLDSLVNNRMTAREVIERTQEKMQQLGPVVERLEDEFLSVIIQRVYNILDRAGAFPPIPDDLVDVLSDGDFKVDYVSPLAQAQKMTGLTHIEQAISMVMQMAQAWPETLKKIDPMGTITKYFEMLGAPAVMQRPDEEVAEMIAEEQKAMAEQQELSNELAVAQAAAPAAQAAKNMTEAANDGNQALAEWMGAPGGY